ncbi:MAG: hypothetical protein ACUVXI_06440 [bacterium]
MAKGRCVDEALEIADENVAEILNMAAEAPWGNYDYVLRSAK